MTRQFSARDEGLEAGVIGHGHLESEVAADSIDSATTQSTSNTIRRLQDDGVEAMGAQRTRTAQPGHTGTNDHHWQT